MDVLDKIIEKLEEHQCKCYAVDRKKRTLTYIGEEISCCSLNSTIADLTGYLITHNIEYTITKDYSIILVNTNEQAK